MTVSGGTAPYTYEWTENGTAISNATAILQVSKGIGTWAYACRIVDSTAKSAQVSATLFVIEGGFPWWIVIAGTGIGAVAIGGIAIARRGKTSKKRRKRKH